MRLLVVVAGLATIAVLAAPARAHWTPGDLVHLRRHAVNLAWCGGTERWCFQGREAWRVAGCESGPSRSPYARNGQYLGMFQMGSWARARYGHAYNSWGQARAAHRYWLQAGWAPWTCAWLAKEEGKRGAARHRPHLFGGEIRTLLAVAGRRPFDSAPSSASHGWSWNDAVQT